MTFWVVKGACLSEERRVKSEKFDTLVDYFLELKSNVSLRGIPCATDMNQQD